MAIADGITSSILESFNSLLGVFSPVFQNFIKLFLLVLIIVVYSVFIWKFHEFISKKNILGLNLKKYNKSAHPVLFEVIALGFYLLEYIIVLPFLIFFWFSIFALFLIFLTEGVSLQNLLIVSAVIVSAIRMASYYNEDLSKDLAKLLPFTLLAISLLDPSFFDIERIFNRFSELSNFFGEIIIYFIFIAILEIILRFFDFLFSILSLNEEMIDENK